MAKKTTVKKHKRKVKKGKTTVKKHNRKIKSCKTGLAWDPRTKKCVPCPGGKIRSQGTGRGLGRGRGRGPIGIPIRRKNFGAIPKKKDEFGVPASWGIEKDPKATRMFGSHPQTGKTTPKEAKELLFEITKKKNNVRKIRD